MTAATDETLQAILAEMQQQTNKINKILKATKSQLDPGQLRDCGDLT